MPQASTAIVQPPAARAPRWAAASMPYAPPDTTVQPRSARPKASSPATWSPYPVLARAPTTATDCSHASARAGSPRNHTQCGGNVSRRIRSGPSTLIRASWSSWCGHSSSSGVTMRTPSRWARASARSTRWSGSASARRGAAAARSSSLTSPTRSRATASTGPTRATSRPSARLPGSTRWASAMRARRTATAFTRSRPCAAPAPRSRRRGSATCDRRGPQWTTRPAAPGRSRARTAIPGPAGWPGRP